MRDLGKVILAKGFKKLPKALKSCQSAKIVQSGHTVNDVETMEETFELRSRSTQKVFSKEIFRQKWNFEIGQVWGSPYPPFGNPRRPSAHLEIRSFTRSLASKGQTGYGVELINVYVVTIHSNFKFDHLHIIITRKPCSHLQFTYIWQPPPDPLISRFMRGARLLSWDEGLYLPKREAVEFIKCLNNRDCVWKAITKFVWQLDRYEPSSPSTKELQTEQTGKFLKSACSLSLFNFSLSLSPSLFIKVKQRKKLILNWLALGRYDGAIGQSHQYTNWAVEVVSV